MEILLHIYNVHYLLLLLTNYENISYYIVFTIS